MALCRLTRMGSFFNGPSEPPDFLKVAFPDPDELKCVRVGPCRASYILPLLMDTVPPLSDVLIVDPGREGRCQPLDSAGRAVVPLSERDCPSQYKRTKGYNACHWRDPSFIVGSVCAVITANIAACTPECRHNTRMSTTDICPSYTVRELSKPSARPVGCLQR
jgi:hypothetical protein